MCHTSRILNVKSMELGFLNEKIKRPQVRDLREAHMGHLPFYGNLV